MDHADDDDDVDHDDDEVVDLDDKAVTGHTSPDDHHEAGKLSYNPLTAKIRI